MRDDDAPAGEATRPCALAARDETRMRCSEIGATDGAEFICQTHLRLASPAVLARKRQTGLRLQWIRERWVDDAFYEQAVATGRYLKLCEVLRWAEDTDALAWDRLKVDILHHAGESARAPARPAAAG